MMVCRRLPTFRFELLFPYLFLFVGISIDGVDPWSRRTPVWTYAFTHYKVQGLGVSYLTRDIGGCAHRVGISCQKSCVISSIPFAERE